jgi:hypothetical protein
LRLPINAVIAWDMFFAWRLNIARAQLAERLPTLLDIVFDLEALTAGWRVSAGCNPGYSTPTFSPAKCRTAIAAYFFVGLGHPVIRAKSAGHQRFTLGKLADQDCVAHPDRTWRAKKSTFYALFGIGCAWRMQAAWSMPARSRRRDARFYVYSGERLIVTAAVFYAEVRRVIGIVEARIRWR